MTERCPIETCDKANKLDDSLMRLLSKLDELTEKVNDIVITMSKQSVKFEDFDKRCQCLEKIGNEVSEIKAKMAVIEDRQNRSLIAGAAGGLGSGGAIVALIELIRYILGMGR